MKGLRSIPKILKINEVTGYKVSFLFNNGESRTVDFKKFFGGKKLSKKHPAYKLMKDINEFKQIEIIGNTIGWKNTGLYLKNISGEKQFFHFDLDPIVLLENSTPDESRNLKIGKLIKAARKEAGLTQEELARKSGTSKHYISRLENSKSDIELLTLKKIIEAGLGKRLSIQIN
ncbi:MAG TPA: XRE family transcriptional regulator [Bacteroidetes bacterium]|nr:XRE family transcriptional regulator [Bacteroidota bacterium]